MATTLGQTWDTAYSGSDRWLLRLLPSLTDLAFVIPIVLMLVTFPDRLSSLLGDGDTGWHLRTGDWILAHRAVPHVDLFSFTKSGQPWFAWEWAWDAVFAEVHQVSGLAGVVWVNTIILGCVSAALYRLVRRSCEHDVLALAVTALAMCASMTHWLARPHLLSWLLFLVLLHIVSRAKENPTFLRWTPLLACVWTNVHGSFFLVPVTLGISSLGTMAAELFSETPDLRRAWRNATPWTNFTLLSAAATLMNPYGFGVHRHIWRYLRSDGMLRQISEFQSISFHDNVSRFFECMLLLGIAAILLCLRRRRWVDAFPLLFWAHLALLSVRNIPLYCFVAAPVVGQLLQCALDEPVFAAILYRPAVLMRSITAQLRPFERIERLHCASILLLVYFGAALLNARPGFEAKLPKTFPHSALPVIATVKPQRIFASDQWSDFLIYADPSRKVFFDGRSDFYGPDFVDRYLHILNARWDWNTDLQKFLVDMVIVPPSSALATVLKSSPQWSLLFDDGDVAVFGIKVSAVVRNGGRQLGAVSASKYRTTIYERRCL